MRRSLQSCVLATLSYSDIFDYPLTENQIHKFLIERKTNFLKIDACLKKLLDEKKIGKKGKFYFLAGREKIVEIRRKRELVSKDKLEISRRIAGILKLIPGIKFIGISGALACQNSKSTDDIDLFIITKNKSVWTTRFFSTLILDFLGKRRKPQDKEFKDKICLNLFLDENDLYLGPGDIFLAREIAQLVPLYDRDSSYFKFLIQNSWIKKFLPNWKPGDRDLTERNRFESRKSKNLLNLGCWLLETVLRTLQLFYMRRRITCEKLSKTKIFFHPSDVHYQILKEYQKRIAQLPS